jgi:hypothetical protein
MLRLRTPAGLSQVTFHQPVALIAIRWSRGRNPWAANSGGRTNPGCTLKIYMLMLLIGAIAAMSHLNFDRKSAEQKG